MIYPFRRLRTSLAAAAVMLMAGLSGCDGSGSVTGVRDYQLTVVDGDGQVGEAGSQLGAPLVVLVTAAGLPVVGVEVEWRAEENSGEIAPVTVTDAGGYARAYRSLGPGAGERGTVASVGSAAARFTSMAQVQGAVHMHMHPTDGGNTQVDTVQAMLQPLRVLVTDHHGAPVAGVQVHWSGATSPTVTDAAGVAAFVHQLGPAAGASLIHADVPGLIGSPVSFVAMARAGRPVDFVKVGGDEQMGLKTSRLAPLYVVVRDVRGNHVSGVRLSWTAADDGVIETAHQVTPENAYASATRWLGPEDGVYTTTVSTDVAGLPTLTFTATAVTAIVLVTSPDSYWCWYYGTICGVFAPESTVIAAGQTVGWRWDGTFACDLVFQDAPAPPTSSQVQLHGTHIRSFPEPGIYPYSCTTASATPEAPVATVIVQ